MNEPQLEKKPQHNEKVKASNTPMICEPCDASMSDCYVWTAKG